MISSQWPWPPDYEAGHKIKTRKVQKSEVWGSRSGTAEDSNLLGCCAIFGIISPDVWKDHSAFKMRETTHPVTQHNIQKNWTFKVKKLEWHFMQCERLALIGKADLEELHKALQLNHKLSTWIL